MPSGQQASRQRYRFCRGPRAQSFRESLPPRCTIAWGANLYSRPKTLDAAVQVLAEEGGQLLSGGTDFFPALGDRPAPDRVVDISGIAAIRGIAFEADHIRIGGLTTWSQLVAT